MPGSACETDRAKIEEYLFGKMFSFVYIEEFVDPTDQTYSVVPRVGTFNQHISNLDETKELNLAYTYNFVVNVEEDDDFEKTFGQLSWISSDQKVRKEGKPYLSFSLQESNKRQMIYKSNRLGVMYLVVWLGILGGVWSPLSTVAEFIVKFSSKEEFAKFTVDKLFLTKKFKFSNSKAAVADPAQFEKEANDCA